MRSRSERDRQTVTIATALALLVVVMLVGVSVLGLLGLLADPSRDAQRSIFLVTLAAAVLVSGWYLLRHRRP